MSDAYARAGVNLVAGNEFSKYCFELAKSTFTNCPYLDIEMEAVEDYFRGDLSWLPKNLPPGARLEINADGVGTKTLLPGIHPTVGHDLVAMAGGDAVRKGGVPLAITNVLDVRSLGEVGSPTYKLYQQTMAGLYEAAGIEGIAMYRGETAELGPCVGSENPTAEAPFNWAGFVLSAKDPAREITGKDLDADQIIVAIREYGLRSNGLSKIREFLRLQFGKEWWNNPAAAPHIRLATIPSVLWARFIATMNGWYAPDFKPVVKMTAIAHITGGGIPEKFGEDLIFRAGLSAIIDKPWDPPRIMQDAAFALHIGKQDFFRIFNGGQGILVVVKTPEDAHTLIGHAVQKKLEAKIVGRTFKARLRPELMIRYISGESAYYSRPTPNQA